MSSEPQPEPTGHVERAAQVSWDESGSFGFDGVPSTARDMSAEEHFWADYTAVELDEQ